MNLQDMAERWALSAEGRTPGILADYDTGGFAALQGLDVPSSASKWFLRGWLEHVDRAVTRTTVQAAYVHTVTEPTQRIDFALCNVDPGSADSLTLLFALMEQP